MHDTFVFERFVGRSQWTERVRRRILRIAKHDFSVLITGPAGTGKELCARAIHAHSRHSHGPFVPFRCSLVSPAWQRAQLLGHDAGSFSLAHGAAIGCLRAAGGGVLYLDEVADLDPAVQRELVSWLRSPVDHDVDTADLRLIASSSRDLGREAEAGRFSWELLCHIDCLQLHTSPLSQRREDIQPLVQHFVARTTLENGLPLKQITPAAMALLRTFDWEGHVDQLQDLIERVVLLHDDAVIGQDVFAQMLAEEAIARGAAESVEIEPDTRRGSHLETVPDFDVVAGRWPSLRRLEETYIRHTLEQAQGYLPVAADLLGVSLPELREKMQDHGIPQPMQSESLF